jgi:GAF domain-containing protein
MVGQHNISAGGLAAAGRIYPLPVADEGSMLAKVIRDGVLHHMPDIDQEMSTPPEFLRVPRALGVRSHLIVPMLHERTAIGGIIVGRSEVGPFSEAQIALLQTFADQAVIAIENARLFEELQEKNQALTEAHAQVTEALEQQTATSEILRVISSSPTDVQPVFDTIVASATRLCSGLFSAVYRYDGELIHLVAHHNFSPTALAAARQTFPMPPSRGGATARAVLTCEVVHIPDLRLEPEYAHGALARDLGFPSILAVPMLRDGLPIGAIAVAGAEAAPFSDKQITLLKTFADQAVIAIENVRLFTELQGSNRELTTALLTRRLPPATSCASSVARRRTCSRCLTRSWSARCACWAAMQAC